MRFVPYLLVYLGVARSLTSRQQEVVWVCSFCFIKLLVDCTTGSQARKSEKYYLYPGWRPCEELGSNTHVMIIFLPISTDQPSLSFSASSPCVHMRSRVMHLVVLVCIYSGTSIIRTPLATGVWILVWIIENVRIKKINTEPLEHMHKLIIFIIYNYFITH